RDVVRVNRPGAAAAGFLHRDVHCFKLELSTKDTAAHDPIVDCEDVRLLRVGTQDHCTNQAVVAEFVEQAELQSDGFGRRGATCNLFGGVSPSCGVELIGLVDQLRDAPEVGGRERAEYHGH